jgi:glycerophosphoryl diester phosphodiesterase
MLDLRRPPGGLPLLVAHRGASKLAPENTMAAFRLAAEAGADIVELDVRLSADGHVVILHDGHVCRTTNGWGAVAGKTLAELKTLDAGGWFSPRFAGEPVPILAEVLAWAQAQEPPMRLMIELKGGSQTLEGGLVEKSVQRILAHAMASEVIFISSYHPFLERARRVAPAIATGTIVKLNAFDRWLPRLLRVLPGLARVGPLHRRLLWPLAISRALGANALSIPATALTASLVEAAHVAGLAVSPGGGRWDYPAVIALGADTISAEDPAAVRAAHLSPQI